MEKVSLLKPYTRFDFIKSMDIDEMAEFLTRTTKCVFCDDEVMQEKTDCVSLKDCTEYCKWKQWLEGETTKMDEELE